MLERPLTTRFSHSCDVRNDCYSTVNEVILLLCLHAFMLVMTLSLSSSSVMLYIQETLIELKLRDAYEHESRSVPNLTDPSYTHIAKRNSQSISTVPDVVFRSKSENTTVNIGFVLLYHWVLCSFIQDDYDVLSQQSINFQDATNGSRFHSCYEDISEVQ